MVTSKLNYFLSSDKHYFGAYARYYTDTSKIGSSNENKDTLQEYPSFQYHKFTDSFILPNVLYSVDLHSHNYTRKIGVKATQYEFNLPVSFHLPLADDYLKFSYYHYLYATHVDYAKKMYRPTGDEDKSANYIENYHKFSLQTDLAKAYESFYHSLNLGVDYVVKAYNEGDLPDRYETAEDDGNVYVYDMLGRKYQSFINPQHTRDEVSARATQYFFNEDGRKFLRHTISQGYYTKENKRSNLKNIIGWYPLPNLSFYNRLEYSYDNKYFEKVQSGASYTHDKFGASLWHTMQRKNAQEKQNYLHLNGYVELPHNYRLFSGTQYDLERDYNKQWQLGVSHRRKCWNYTFVYEEELEPTTTTSGTAAKKSRGVYFFINFYPMGGVHYDFSVGQTTQGS